MDPERRKRILSGQTFSSDFDDEGDPFMLWTIGIPLWIIGMVGLLSPGGSEGAAFSGGLLYIGIICSIFGVSSFKGRRRLKAQAKKEAAAERSATTAR